MLFLKQLHRQEQGQGDDRHIINHTGQVKHALYKVDKGLIDAKGIEYGGKNPGRSDDIGDTRSHIQKKQNAKGQHRRDDLAFCHCRQEQADGKAGRSEQGIAQNRRIGHG